MEPFIGEIRMFGGDFAPKGWAACDGELLATNQNSALFSLIGDTYGGDGRATFGLPDLQGRYPIHRSEDLPQGKGQEQMELGSGSTPYPGFLSILFIIALTGVYPPRS